MDRFLPKWKTYRDELNNLPVSYSIVNTVHRQIASVGLSSFIELKLFRNGIRFAPMLPQYIQ